MKLKVVFVIFILILMLSSNIYASTIGEMFSQADDAISIGKNNSHNKIDSKQLSIVSGQIYDIFLAIGTVVAVIVGAILGIQFMTAGIDKKVKVKEALIAYVISCIVLFGSLGIWKLTTNIVDGITAPTTTSGSSGRTHRSAGRSF